MYELRINLFFVVAAATLADNQSALIVPRTILITIDFFMHKFAINSDLPSECMFAYHLMTFAYTNNHHYGWCTEYL